MSEIQELYSLLTNKGKAESWIVEGIRQVKFEDLERAIRNNEPADDILFSHFNQYLQNSITRKVIILIFRMYWPEVEKILCDVPNLYKILTDNRQEFRDLLSSPEGIAWLNSCAKRGYMRLWKTCWN